MTDLTQTEVWHCIDSDAAEAFPDQPDKISRYLNTPQGERMWRHYQDACGSSHRQSRNAGLGHSSDNMALARLQREGRAITQREGVSEAEGLARASMENPALYADYREAQSKEAQRQQLRLAKQRQDELAREVTRRGIGATR